LITEDWAGVEDAVGFETVAAVGLEAGSGAAVDVGTGTGAGAGEGVGVEQLIEIELNNRQIAKMIKDILLTEHLLLNCPNFI
jgi:hypothetical protein